jgi:hypothetical protein
LSQELIFQILVGVIQLAALAGGSYVILKQLRSDVKKLEHEKATKIDLNGMGTRVKMVEERLSDSKLAFAIIALLASKDDKQRLELAQIILNAGLRR